MKIKNRTYKNLLFALILTLSGVYAILLLILIRDLLQSCIIKLAEIMAISDTSNFFYAVLSVPEFFISFIGLIILSYLFFRISLSVFSVYIDYQKTKELVASSKLIDRGNFYEIKTKKDYLFTFGIFNPKVYLSTSAIDKLTKDELASVLLHERFHVMSKDPMKELILRFIKRSIPKFMFPSVLFEKYNTAVELAADEFAFNKSGTQKHLISSLVKILSFDTNFVFKSFADEADRVKVLTKKSSFSILKTLMISTITILIALVSTVGVSASRPFNQCRDYDVCMQKTLESDSGGEKCVVFEYVDGNFEMMSREVLQNK